MASRFLFLLLFVFTAAQTPSPSPPDLPSILLPNFTPTNEVATILFPLPVVRVETPIAVRFVLFLSLSTYTPAAACHPTALGFLGKKDPIPSSLCQPTPRAILFSLILHRLLASQFPLDAVPYAEFLQRNGLDPFSNSTDTNTENGWANVVADELLNYFESDGWNSLGDQSRMDFKQQYSDFTGYTPKNPPMQDPMQLKRPLRWQPLTQAVDGRGRFASQVHVTPHIGLTVKPLVLSMEDYESRKAPSPYVMPNSKKNISADDTNTMNNLISKLFNTSAAVTEEQVALAWWWDNKFFSLGFFSLVYQQLLDVDPDQGTFLVLGELLAQHDAILLAWKEKRRHDLVRPPTMVKRFLKGETVRAWKSIEEGVGEVKAEDWEPVVRIQPHSEFPSASAVICTATMEQLEVGLKSLIGKNATLPAFEWTIQAFSPPGSPVPRDVNIRFETLKEAGENCGESRLWAGVHFEPSVTAGNELAKGLGTMARKHVEDLIAGKVPENCARCIS